MAGRDDMRVRHAEELIWLVPLAGFAASVFLAAQLLGIRHGVSAAQIVADYGIKVMLVAQLLLPLLLMGLCARALLVRSENPLRDLAEPLRARFGSPMLALSTIAPLLLMSVVIAAYGVLKQLMPLFTPFVWDDAFAAADRALFLGHQPWELTHALFGSYTATLIIDRFYTLWVALLFFAILGFALFAPRYIRARFFLSFSAAWILLGVVGAYLGASAGPCYSALIGAATAPEFAALMERLQDYSANHGELGAVTWQGVLWDAHVDRNYGFAMGISAMPSLHNAIAVLYALVLARSGRPWNIIGWGFAVLILIGSVHLGWHYAVDGIVSGVAMMGIWWAAGRFLERSGYVDALSRPQPELAEPQPAST